MRHRRTGDLRTFGPTKADHVQGTLGASIDIIVDPIVQPVQA
jgi:hypothetical protein